MGILNLSLVIQGKGTQTTSPALKTFAGVQDERDNVKEGGSVDVTGNFLFNDYFSYAF